MPNSSNEASLILKMRWFAVVGSFNGLQATTDKNLVK
jgi:hypothetical protein